MTSAAASVLPENDHESTCRRAPFLDGVRDTRDDRIRRAGARRAAAGARTVRGRRDSPGAAARGTGRLRHGAAPADPRLHRRRRADLPLGVCVPARRQHPHHRAPGRVAADSRRRARPGPDRGRPRGLAPRAARRPDGRRRASGLRAEPARLPDLLQAHADGVDGRPGPRALRGRGAVRGPRRVRRRRGDERRRVAGGLRPGRNALHDAGRGLRRAAAARAGPGEPRRQGAAPAGRRHRTGRQPVRRPGGRAARGVLARAPQPHGAGHSPGDGGRMGERARADGGATRST